MSSPLSPLRDAAASPSAAPAPSPNPVSPTPAPVDTTGVSAPASAVPSVAPSSPAPLARVDLSALPNPCAHVQAVPIVPLQFAEPRKPVNFQDGWDYYRRIGSPRHICAPMVNQSELAFRMLCRNYNTNLCYTPMFHAEIFGKDPSYRAEAMQQPPTPAHDRPLVAQFCANDPQLLLKAAKFVEHQVDAVDINLGCPQGIAKRGHYGSFLLTEYQLLHDMVSTLHQHLSIPVTVKIRGLPAGKSGPGFDLEATIALVRMLEQAGAALITIHGRTRHQLKDKVGACDFDLIRLVKQNAHVPVFANGGIYDMADVERCLAHTGVDGVMSSEALLCNPSIFSGRRVDSIQIAREYMQIVANLEPEAPTDQSMVRAHLFKILFQHVTLHHDLRDRLAHCDPADFNAIVSEVASRFSCLAAEDRAAQLARVPVWYHRHMPTAAQLEARAEKARRKAEEREAQAADEEEGLCEVFSMFDAEACEDDGCTSAGLQQLQA